ncbi:hypothetical protein GC167_01820 [bacterium]|nr:hypothetical protein [bacterium]
MLLTLVGLIWGMEGWFLGTPAAAEAHDYHVAVAEATWAKAGWSVSALFFADDLERALNTTGVAWDTPEADSLLRPYLSSHFGWSGAAPSALDWVGHRSEGEQIRCFFRWPLASDRAPSSGLRVRFDALMEVYPDQKNLLHVRKDGRNKSYYYSLRDPIQTIQ